MYGAVRPRLEHAGAVRGIVSEHRTVRAAAGLFGVSHMGVIDLTGSAAACVARLACLDIKWLAVERVQEQGVRTAPQTTPVGLLDER